MEQIYGNWTAPTFSFDEADKPHAWEIFYLTSQDYLEVLRIKPAEEDKEKRGWEQITQMFTGENRQILQNLVDNNTITETHQRTPILALKAIQKAIEDGKHHLHHKDDTPATTTATKSATTTTKNSTKCPWKQFYKRIIKYMDSLHEEPLEPQMKIDTFVSAIRNTFPIETSTKQTQTSEQPRKMAQTQTTEQLSSSTPNSDTDSVYNTESDSNDAAHLPRPSKATHAKQISTNQRKQPTPTHPNPTPDVKPQQKSPLLPTPPAPVRNFNCNNHHNQHISRPSASSHYKQHIPGPRSRYSTYPTFTRPSPFYNTYPTFSGPANYRYYRSHQQHHISRPHTARFNNQWPPLLPRPSDQHQNFMTGPYQQHQHFPQQVFHIHISLPYTGWRQKLEVRRYRFYIDISLWTFIFNIRTINMNY